MSIFELALPFIIAELEARRKVSREAWSIKCKAMESLPKLEWKRMTDVTDAIILRVAERRLSMAASKLSERRSARVEVNGWELRVEAGEGDYSATLYRNGKLEASLHSLGGGSPLRSGFYNVISYIIVSEWDSIRSQLKGYANVSSDIRKGKGMGEVPKDL